MRRVGTADSAPVTYSGMKIYLLRTSTMVARGAGKFELGWKSPRGTSDARRIDDSTPVFAEMAAPGMVFEGLWKENSAQDRQKLFQASNSFAASQIQRHKAYAEATGLERLAATLGDLEKRVTEAGNAAGNDACILALGWGAGMLSKISVGDTADPSYRSILRHVSLYQKAVQTGLPFPKTRRIVFEGGRPAHLPGWVLLEIAPN
jgi:CRISPR-associated protein Csm5